eukprot:1149442-Pelagomonas_calceolata.AAC.1
MEAITVDGWGVRDHKYTLEADALLPCPCNKATHATQLYYRSLTSSLLDFGLWPEDPNLAIWGVLSQGTFLSFPGLAPPKMHYVIRRLQKA